MSWQRLFWQLLVLAYCLWYFFIYAWQTHYSGLGPFLMDAVLGLSFGLGLLFLFDGWVLKPLTWLWHKLVELVTRH